MNVDAMNPAKPGAPSAPTSLVATATTMTTVSLAFTDNASDESGFRMERRQGEAAPWAKVGDLAANVTTFEDQGLPPSTSYRYRVFAVNAKGDSNPSNVATATTQGMLGALNIPTTRPRIWLTGARLERAKEWWKSNAFTPLPKHENYEWALAYMMTGNKAYARHAIDWMLSVEVTTGGVASDPARYNGEQVAIVFDWCYDVMTAVERQTIIDRWSQWLEELNAKMWGGPEMPGSNYFWGRVRNDLLFPIATFHENPKATSLLSFGLDMLWKAFDEYADKESRGGIPHEGTQYGRYMLAYPTIMMSTAKDLGRDMWSETNFFKEAVFWLIYATPPAPTNRTATKAAGWEFFPFGEDSFFRGGASAENLYSGIFLAMAIDQWKDLPVGGYAQRYLDQVKPPVNFVVRAGTVKGTPRPGFEDLPLDFHGAGINYMYAKNTWKPDATVVKFQMGKNAKAEHNQLDSGSFQIWRGGEWISRESVAYAGTFNGWHGIKKVEPMHSAVHNMVLFNGYGMANAYHKGVPVTNRLESRPDYAYATVDLTGVYLSTSEKIERDVNPFVKRLLREFLFVRGLETLLVLDRYEATATDVTTSFLLHSEADFQISGRGATSVIGGQTLRSLTLLPTTAKLTSLSEEGSSNQGQYRLEVDTTGVAQGHMLHAIQARPNAGTNLTATAEEKGTTLVVTLSIPGKGKAKVVFEKGLDSAGGTFGFAADGSEPTQRPLTDKVQKMVIGDDGPVWMQ
jgi:hypothetical protein